MPICNKPPMPVGSRKGTTEIDDHASEAAKLKRAREQAYFNSYDFDAIEVLPDDDEEDDDRGGGGGGGGIVGGDNNKTLTKYLPRQERVPHVATTVADSSSSNFSSSSSSGRSNSGKVINSKYNYLQRLGTFFISSHQTSSSNAAAHPTLSHEVKSANVDGNFLLPRAMLKYQSVGASNSMPLTALATQQQQHHQQPQLHIAAGSKVFQNDNKAMMASSSLSALPGSSNNNDPSSKRLAYKASNGEHEDADTGFSLTKKENLVMNKKTLPRNKKQSTGSTITTTTTTTTASLTTSIVSEDELPISTAAVVRSGSMPNIHTNPSKNTNSVAIKSKVNTNNDNKTKTAIISTTTIANEAAQQPLQQHGHGHGHRHGHGHGHGNGHGRGHERGRANSHQSHYSTDKSGSSGYYSSNVCSTYSIEDHIYCEPVIDILDSNGNSKSKSGQSAKTIKADVIFTTAEREPEPLPSSILSSSAKSPVEAGTTHHSDSQAQVMNGIGLKVQQRFSNGNTGMAHETEDDDDDEDDCADKLQYQRFNHHSHHQPSNFNEKLRILESSIDNLDRHLKRFSNLSPPEHIVSFMHSQHHQIHNHHHHHHQHQHQNHEFAEKLRLPYNHLLPTIMEGYDPATQPRPWQDEIADDSLLDIDLDSFLLTNEAKDTKRKATKTPPIATATATRTKSTISGIDNPTFITDDELEENNYKCAKYINSCPENAYNVESDIVGSASQKSLSAEHYMRRYEDQLHFQNTRELLEDVRDKIRILSQSSSEDLHSNSSQSSSNHKEQPTNNENQFNSARNDQGMGSGSGEGSEGNEVPNELKAMIKTLKTELESYLDRMNQHSEYEIRQFCSGLVKNENIVKMKKAFEKRSSLTEYDYYEAIRNGGDSDAFKGALVPFSKGVPAGIRQQIASIRCASDPNFKMKRKSLTDVFPVVTSYMEALQRNREGSKDNLEREQPQPQPQGGLERYRQTQMQRNLSFHKPILNQFESGVVANATDVKHAGNVVGNSSGSNGNVSSGRNSIESGESSGDKDSILDWHRKKPSIWEMYYGTNRMNQSLLGKRNGMVVNVNQSSMSYPSSRPESDFTLDLPRAEQLRIKMEKEKKFRQRCRYITTLLSLVFFLLTVMVVSLVLTRGKRMFGSMI